MVRWVTHLTRSLLALTSFRWISSGIVGNGSTAVVSRALPVVALITQPRYLNPRFCSQPRRGHHGNDNLHRLCFARRHENGRLDVASPTEQSRRHRTRHSSCTTKKGGGVDPATTHRPGRKRAMKSLVTPTKLASRKLWVRPRGSANTPSPPAAAGAAAAAAAAGAVGATKPPSPPVSAAGCRFVGAATIRPTQPSSAPRKFGALGFLSQRDDDVYTLPPETGGRRNAHRANRVPFRPPGVGPLLGSAWRCLMLLEGCCEATWVGKASAHVLAGALASSHSVVAGLVVGLAVWASCAKRLTGSEDDWKLVTRLTLEVAVLWYCHALPHGLGAGRPLRGNFGTGNAGDLLGACWHFLGQGAFIRLVAASGRLVRLNVLEANALLLGLSHLGNRVAGSRMRRVFGEVAEAHTYQLRGFFSRTNGIFGEKPFLSLPFDSADTFLALQGILSATEREVVQKNGVLASAFRDFAAQSANTLDAHSLGAVGARNLMGMGFIAARVRMFGRPALSLGWTAKANNMCMVGDPICGSLLQKLLDPTCVMLKGRGHLYDAYVACVGCLASQ